VLRVAQRRRRSARPSSSQLRSVSGGRLRAVRGLRESQGGGQPGDALQPRPLAVDYAPVLSSVRSWHRTGQKSRAFPTPGRQSPCRRRHRERRSVRQRSRWLPRQVLGLLHLHRLRRPCRQRRPHRPFPGRALKTRRCATARRPRAARTRGQRRAFLGIGPFILFSCVHDIRTGKAKAGPRYSGTCRAKQTWAFWTIVALQFGIAGALLAVAAREATAARRQRRASGCGPGDACPGVCHDARKLQTSSRSSDR
jgi:hypothetical protein